MIDFFRGVVDFIIFVCRVDKNADGRITEDEVKEVNKKKKKKIEIIRN